jgi:hypothetical protein
LRGAKSANGCSGTSAALAHLSAQKVRERKNAKNEQQKNPNQKLPDGESPLQIDGIAFPGREWLIMPQWQAIHEVKA